MWPPPWPRSSGWRRRGAISSGWRCRIWRRRRPWVASAGAIHIPLVADIHFDYKLALECVRQGIDKIRINPGNIGGQEKVRAVADACRSEGIPIRIGVNGGSLERELLAKIRRRHPGGAGGERHGPCPSAERLQFRRHLHLREVLPCAGDHGGLSAAAPADGLPPASGSHRGGYALGWGY